MAHPVQPLHKCRTRCFQTDLPQPCPKYLRRTCPGCLLHRPIFLTAEDLKDLSISYSNHLLLLLCSLSYKDHRSCGEAGAQDNALAAH